MLGDRSAHGSRGGVAAVHIVLLGVSLNDPTDEALEEIVRDLTAVAKIDLLEPLGSVGHFEDCLRGDVPDAAHSPSCHAGSAGSGKGREAFVRDMEAITYVDHAWTWTHEGANVIDQKFVCHDSVVRAEI